MKLTHLVPIAFFLCACVQSEDSRDADGGSGQADGAADQVSSQDSGHYDAADQDGPEWCPLTGATCPAGCDIVVGTPYDRDGDCYLKGEVVACHHGTLAGTAETCRLKVETDTLYWFGTTLAPLEPDVPGWVECSEADSAKVVMAKGWCE